MNGEVQFKGTTLYSVTRNGVSSACKNDFKAIRGSEIAYVTQEPRISLDPLFTIGQHIEEHLKKTGICRRERRQKAYELLRMVRLNPDQVYGKFSYQLSGGMCQLATIAIAISTNPTLLIADEPTTFLDARFQESILALLLELQKNRNLTIMFITHSMQIVEKIADKVIVMYNGTVLEEMLSSIMFSEQMNIHPYTRMLLNRIDYSVNRKFETQQGCPFAERCLYFEKDKCYTSELMPMEKLSNNHRCRCVRMKQ